MRFINKWSYACAHSLANQLGDNHEKRRIYYYGFQIVIGSIVKGVIIATVCLLLGILKETAAVLVFFAALRLFAGGYHMNTQGKCLIASMAMFLLSGIFVKFTYEYWSTPFLAIFTAVTFIIGLIAMLKWAPADTPNRPITKPEQIRKFKIFSVLEVCIWVILNSLLVFYGMRMFALAGCIGVLLAAFIISPAGYGFFDALAGKLTRPRKRSISL